MSNLHRFALAAALSFAGCSKPAPGFEGVFVDPSGTAVVTIRGGSVVTRDAAGSELAHLTYVVKAKDATGTTLSVSDGAWHQEWLVTPDGQELHGASSPAKVVFRRRAE